MSDLWKLNALEAVELLGKGEISPLDMIESCAERIEATDDGLNVMPTRCFDRARDHARRLMDGSAPVADGPGALHGLPFAVKELEDVAGVRTTYGSHLFADHVPKRSDIMVETLEARGGIVMGKSNVPEYGAGGQSFNEVLGVARNPWDRERSTGGSSGGSAGALAAGQVPIATGSDLGGSLRIPASFCGIVGFRPTPGVVAKGPDPGCFADMPVAGPMARNVPDTALMLDAMAGVDVRDPLSRAEPAVPYLDQVRQALDTGTFAGCIGYSPDLKVTPVDAEIDAICRQGLERLTPLGCEIVDTDLDLSDGAEAFQTFRALGFAVGHEHELKADPGKLKPENQWNIRKGLELSVEDIIRAHRIRGALYHRVVNFFGSHDLLALPSTIVTAIPTTERYLRELNGHWFGNYVDWIILTSVVTLTVCPAISIPCGFTKAGMPVGLQLVARSHADGQLLAWSAVAERVLGIAETLPIDPRGEIGAYPDPEPEPHGD
ncbi:MAG: amidase [Rhodospirillales bacterium]|nr:amidase [Rhodospirillales bacterium]